MPTFELVGICLYFLLRCSIIESFVRVECLSRHQPFFYFRMICLKLIIWFSAELYWPMILSFLMMSHPTNGSPSSKEVHEPDHRIRILY